MTTKTAASPLTPAETWARENAQPWAHQLSMAAYTAGAAAGEVAVAALRNLLAGSEHRSVCDYPPSVRFRCEDCDYADKAEQDARHLLAEVDEGGTP